MDWSSQIRSHPCLHMQLTSSSHPPEQSLFGRYTTSPSSATKPAQLHCSDQGNGNQHGLQAWPRNIRALSCYTQVQPSNAGSCPALTLSRPGCR